jgi:hypothetical protein
VYPDFCMVLSVQRFSDYAMNHQPDIFSSPLIRWCIVRDRDSVVYNSLKNMFSHSVNVEMLLNEIQCNTGKFQRCGVCFFLF